MFCQCTVASVVPLITLSETEYHNELIQNVVLAFQMPWLIEFAMSLFSFSVLLFTYLLAHPTFIFTSSSFVCLSLQWLNEEKLAQRLIELIHPERDEEVRIHTNKLFKHLFQF